MEDKAISALQEELETFDRLFSEKEQGSNGIPTAREIEAMWSGLLSETKDIYAEHISHRLSEVDERPLIDRKKENI